MRNELPGLAGEVQSFFRKMPGMDHGLATGAALVVMNWAADGRCRIRAPWPGPDAGGIHHPELWEPATLHVLPAGPGASLEVMDRAISLFLSAVVPNGSDPLPVLPTDLDSPNNLVVLATCLSTATSAPAVDPHAGPVAAVQAIRGGVLQRVVRMTDTALAYCRQCALEWVRESPTTSHKRIQRCASTAALLALGVQAPVIDADLFVIARSVAVVDHESALRAFLRHPQVLQEGPPLH